MVVAEQEVPAVVVSRPLVIPPMSAEAIAQVAALEQWNLARPQREIHTDHILHGGMYARTVFIPKDVLATGALVKVPTMLTIQGDVIVYIDGEPTRISGYAVVPAAGHRKQVFWAQVDTFLTMTFPTGAKTLEEAEDEFTDEAGRLISRVEGNTNSLIITGG